MALSEEVTGARPLGVSIADRSIVLWRDLDGVARALEDRCPHRRAPLSLGCVKPDGNLQCGYHGWSFDGSGRVIDIPQLREAKRLPPIYRAEGFRVEERDGFVWVDQASEGGLSQAGCTRSPMKLTGSAHIGMEHRRFLELLLDGPQLVLGIAGVRITEYPLADPLIENGRICYARACRKAGGVMPDRLRGDLPLELSISIEPTTGFSNLILRNEARDILIEAAMSPIPAKRGTTAIRWRARALRRTGRGVPFAVSTTVDGAQLARLPADLSPILSFDTEVACARSA